MNLEQNFLEIVSELNHAQQSTQPMTETIISVIDLTLLKKNPELKTLSQLQTQLNTYPVAAVCVYPELLSQLQIPAFIKKATVINYPEGLQSSQQVCQEIEVLIHQGVVDEIDYVFPQGYAQADELKALEHCQKAYQLCNSAQIIFKVILETGNLENAITIYELSQKIIEQGCDFLKTSTGKTPIGATPLAAYAILKAIQDSGSKTCGLKVSGGVSLPEQAWFYITLAEYCLGRTVNKSWFRIGASSLLDKLGT